jgi:hypothetical protein
MRPPKYKIGKISIVKTHPRKGITIFIAEINGLFLRRLRVIFWRFGPFLEIPILGVLPYCKIPEEIQASLLEAVLAKLKKEAIS